ncbi:MAG: SGNH/GDSL hydrolase family protein [Verrucomicrobiales bacterium]|nr:SGNH/GDSL hydrolase family protein [Verrucomicrobiales bacterium]
MNRPLACSLLILLLAGIGTVSAAAKRVLFLGDSMSLGAFGTTLDKRLRECGLAVYTDVTGGATPYYWLREFDPISCDIGHWARTSKINKRVKVIDPVPKVEDLIEQYRPDIVIVQTGANLYSTLLSRRKGDGQGAAEVEQLVEKMCTAVTSRGKKLYWITPPSSHPGRFSADVQQSMLGIMKRVVQKSGRLFDSYAVTKFSDPYPGTDGIHYGPTEAAAWAEMVAADFLKYAGVERPAARNTAQTAPKAARPGAPRKAGPVKSSDKEAEEADRIEVRRAKVIEAAPDNAVTVEIRLTKKSEFATPSEITYERAFGIYEYEVVRVFHGAYDHQKIRVAHPVVWERKIQPCRDWEKGKRLIVELVPLANYPSLANTVQQIDGALPPAPELDIYVPKM